MKRFIAISALFVHISSYSQLMFKLSGDSLKVFSYSGGDEFPGENIDYNYWKGPWNRINMSQNFRYNDANVKLANGVANFVMLKQDSMYPIQPHEIDSSFLKEQKIAVENASYSVGYSAGMLITRQKFHYGLYELRFKVEQGKGVWPAFWFYGGNKNEEIDAFELKGEKNNEIHVDTHCPSGCDKGYKNKFGMNTNWGGWMKVSDYLHNGFNVFLLEWNPGEILWYINGFPLAYFKGDFPNPMNLFLNTQIAADGRAFKPGPDKNTVFPNNFYVDYIRIWKELSPSIIPIIQPGNFVDSERFSSDYTTKPLKKRGLMYLRKKLKQEEGLISVMLSSEKMRVTVLGEITKRPVTIAVLGKKKQYKVTDFSRTNEFDLAKDEHEVELLIISDGREFRRKFIVQKALN